VYNKVEQDTSIYEKGEEMKGSKPDILAAEHIRDGFLPELDELMKGYKKARRKHPETAEYVNGMLNVIGKIRTRQSAKWWIEREGLDVLELIRTVAFPSTKRR